MRIAVLSDTHDWYPFSLPNQLKEADEIWHLGDVCAPETLAEFANLGRPMLIVRGNCDGYDGWPELLEVEREGVAFLLTHVQPQRVPKGISVVLHGHTHVARDELIAGVRWVNPGSITRPRGPGPTFGWLSVADGKLTSWELVRV